jgi:peptidoglycan hydrolase CwlO-like protein
MEITDPSNISQWLTAAFLAVVGLAMGLQVVVKNWKANSTESALLKMMHDELERMSAQNLILSQEIGKLQAELVNLSNQLSELTSENTKLRVEVSNLNTEITRLHGIIKTKATV